MGYKRDFIEDCTKGANDIMDIGGNSIEIKDYCNCVMENLIPKLYSWELEEAAQNNTIKELFIDNISYIMECVQPFFDSDIMDDFNYGKQNYSDYDKSIMIQMCVKSAIDEEGVGDLLGLSYTEIYNYCSCSVNELVSKGYNFGQLKLVEDEDSEVFNEITLPCLDEILSSVDDYTNYTNEYYSEDIIGPSNSSTLELVYYPNSIYKIKIEIDGIVKYFTFDTGASDMVINRELEELLLRKKIIDEGDYLGEELYTLADNSIVIARMIKIDGITLGDYTINNVVVAAIDNGSLLCGVGLLNKFRNWNFNQDSNSLTIYK